MLCHQETTSALENGPFTLNDLQELLSFLNSATTGPNSGSEGSNRSTGSVDERKRRRMISNRESARRSRWRKKRHLEELTEQMNRFTAENRELKNQLSQVVNQCHLVRMENQRLKSECADLKTRLSRLYGTLKLQQQQQQY
ncbi:hypothetical protein SAY86_029546 [Trapa natans]|uniref:BZIP domain-containing protein n=1 Tax=Trapa natans TaxID=22666 RepID=A0AAN7M1G9_TRANT|nr:hypothetical protein SAY86_029546 [Trapa natans]